LVESAGALLMHQQLGGPSGSQDIFVNYYASVSFIVRYHSFHILFSCSLTAS